VFSFNLLIIIMHLESVKKLYQTHWKREISGFEIGYFTTHKDRFVQKLIEGQLLTKQYGGFCFSLTTTPKRIKNIKNTLIRLYSHQQIIPQYIILNIAEKYLRWGDKHQINIEKVKEELNPFCPALIINVVKNDLGPALKLLGTLNLNLKELGLKYIMTIDDDIDYMDNILTQKMPLMERYKNNVIICTRGYKWRDYMTVGYTQGEWLQKIDVAEGFGGILYPVDLFDKTQFMELWHKVLLAHESGEDGKLIFDDDVVFSAIWEKIGIARIRESGSSIYVLPEGNKADALHLQKWNNIGDEHQRKLWIYKRVKKILNLSKT